MDNVIRSYRYRLLPTKVQRRALEGILEQQRILYNAALEERISFYNRKGKSRSFIDQCYALTQCRREIHEMSEVSPLLQRWTLKRVDDAFDKFFKRIKAKQKAGFPRFRSLNRWCAFGFQEFRGIHIDGRRLRFRGMPSGLIVHFHRCLPVDANIRSCAFRRDDKGWSICFHVAVDTPPPRIPKTSVGIDMGLVTFAHQSDGIAIPNPRIARRAEKELRRRQRALQRCRVGSNRRKKVLAGVSKLHRKVVNTRETFLHQQSARIVRDYDLIGVEALQVANMVRSPLFSRAIGDASWSKFLGFLSYKAEGAGATLIRVNPKNTSQRCSGCQEPVPKSLAVRTHSCPHCGLVMDRDHNAAMNILQAVAGLGGHNVAHQSERGHGNTKAFVPGSLPMSSIRVRDFPQ